MTKPCEVETNLPPLEILELDIPVANRFAVVLGEDRLPAAVLHEFACRCAERAISKIPDAGPDGPGWVQLKRMWMVGMIGDDDLIAVVTDAREAALVTTGARTNVVAWAISWAVDPDPKTAAARTVRAAARVSARRREIEEEQAWQLTELRRLIEGME